MRLRYFGCIFTLNNSIKNVILKDLSHYISPEAKKLSTDEVSLSIILIMDRFKAWQTLKTLAQGNDPITHDSLPEESPYNHPDIIRALYFAVENLSSQNKGKMWTQKEDDELISNYRQGMTVEVLAKKHGRSVNAIDWRLFRCGELNEEE
jgi:hypothetical protein